MRLPEDVAEEMAAPSKVASCGRVLVLVLNARLNEVLDASHPVTMLGMVSVHIRGNVGTAVLKAYSAPVVTATAIEFDVNTLRGVPLGSVDLAVKPPPAVSVPRESPNRTTEVDP